MDKVKKSWEKILIKNKANELIKNLYNTDKIIYPKKEDIFNCFKHFKLKDTKVVLLGQDPYIRKNQATGYALSVMKTEKIPPSLKNIFKEMNESLDYFIIPSNGNISIWNKEENVLLLNTSLTVIDGSSNSHKNLWKEITDNIIKTISLKCDFVIFILLGNNAKDKIKLIDCNKHKIITGIHPSPLSAKYNLKGSDKSFFGNNIFKKVNEILDEKNMKRIKWQFI